MSAFLVPVIRPRYFDQNGKPLAGGKLWCYQAGSTIPVATFSDQYGITQNPNPIILDANGECNYWLGQGSFKFVLMDLNNVVQWTTDGVSTQQVSTTEVSWIKVTVPFTALQTAGLTNNVTLFSLPAINVMHGLVIKHSASFVGAGISAVTMQVGLVADPGKFIDSFDALQAPSDTAFDQISTQYVGSFVNPASIVLTATAVGANLSALTGGSLDIYYRILPL